MWAQPGVLLGGGDQREMPAEAGNVARHPRIEIVGFLHGAKVAAQAGTLVEFVS